MVFGGRGLWEVISLAEVMRMGPRDGISVLTGRDTRQLVLSLSLPREDSVR